MLKGEGKEVERGGGGEEKRRGKEEGEGGTSWHQTSGR